MFQAVYYEPESLQYELGQQLRQRFPDIPWYPIASHNSIEEMRNQPNSQFARMKQNLIIGVRKTHRYTENHKVSDYLVPYTSSGCSAMCLYCYLVCHYNKCAYLRLFVNREEMLSRILRTAQRSDVHHTFEIGSNSDLVLENAITGNLEWTIPRFARCQKGFLTFPTKFHMVKPLLSLDHQGRMIFRMSVNPSSIIQLVERGTSTLEKRIWAANEMYRAGYPTGILLAPVILLDGWQREYAELLSILADTLDVSLKKQLVLEIIFMTYSRIHRYINEEAFPDAVRLYQPEQMTGRGKGKYSYKKELRAEAEAFLQEEIARKLPEAHLLYIS